MEKSELGQWSILSSTLCAMEKQPKNFNKAKCKTTEMVKGKRRSPLATQQTRPERERERETFF
jgi:hypothetical protein